MHIKQWLQEPLQKRQCEMIIHETLWGLGILQKQGVYITKRSEGCAADYSTKGKPLQNTMDSKGNIRTGANNDVACFIFGTLQGLIREKYAVI